MPNTGTPWSQFHRNTLNERPEIEHVTHVRNIFVPEVGITKLKEWKNKLQRLHAGRSNATDKQTRRRTGVQAPDTGLVGADGSSSADRALNAAIVNADLRGSFEEYRAIFDRFYADEVEVTSEAGAEPLASF